MCPLLHNAMVWLFPHVREVSVCPQAYVFPAHAGMVVHHFVFLLLHTLIIWLFPHVLERSVCVWAYVFPACAGMIMPWWWYPTCIQACQLTSAVILKTAVLCNDWNGREFIMTPVMTVIGDGGLVMHLQKQAIFFIVRSKFPSLVGMRSKFKIFELIPFTLGCGKTV